MASQSWKGLHRMRESLGSLTTTKASWDFEDLGNGGGRSSQSATGLVWAHQELIGMRTSADTCTSIQPGGEHKTAFINGGPRNKVAR